MHKRLLFAILLGGCLIQIMLITRQGWTSVKLGGGDEFWYLVNGAGLYRAAPMGQVLGYPYAANNIPTAPLYLIFTGLIQQIWGYPLAVGVIRSIQVAWSVLVCYLLYDLGKLLTDDARVGLVVAGAMSFSIPFLLESSKVLTELLYITCMVSSIWLYCKLLARRSEKPHWTWWLLVGCLFGLATLTRAVGLMFPLGIAGHALIVHGLSAWRKGLQIAIMIVFSYSLMISTWTIYNIVRYDNFVIVSNQFFPALWRGATEEDGSPSQNDALLGEQTAQEQSAEIITSDPTGFIRLRARELTSAYLQPHGTLDFGGKSLKVLVSGWVDDGFSASGFVRLIRGEGFFPKLVIYIWHYVALIGGLVGMWLTRKQWQIALVPIGFILYTTLLHFVLLANPRYIFPTYPFYWLFAAVTLIALWDALIKRKQEQ